MLGNIFLLPKHADATKGGAENACFETTSLVDAALRRAAAQVLGRPQTEQRTEETKFRKRRRDQILTP